MRYLKLHIEARAEKKAQLRKPPDKKIMINKIGGEKQW